MRPLGRGATNQLTAADALKVHSLDGALPRPGNHIGGNQRRPSTRRDRSGYSPATISNEVIGDRHIAQILAPAKSDAGDGGVFDDIAGHERVGLNADAVAPGVKMVAGVQVADQVARNHGKPPPLVEIGDRNAGGGIVDQIVGDHRALKSELGIDGDLAKLETRIADKLAVRPGIGAEGGIGARPVARTPPARNTLMALPYWPDPPASARILVMRLAEINVPSLPGAERQI